MTRQFECHPVRATTAGAECVQDGRYFSSLLWLRVRVNEESQNGKGGHAGN